MGHPVNDVSNISPFPLPYPHLCTVDLSTPSGAVHFCDMLENLDPLASTVSELLFQEGSTSIPRWNKFNIAGYARRKSGKALSLSGYVNYGGRAGLPESFNIEYDQILHRA